MTQYQNITELLQKRLESNCGITFINEKLDQFIAYGKVYRKALQFLSYFQSSGLAAKRKVIIVLNNNEWFLYAMWAAMLGNMIPIPIAPGNNNAHRLKLIDIWKDLDYPQIVTSEDILGKMEGYFEETADYPMLDLFKTKAVVCGPAIFRLECAEVINSNPDDIAYIQYTSGTTAKPKGIALTHRNLLTNLAGMAESCRISEEDSMLAWLPLSHDMGFSGTHLLPLWAGINQYIMPTAMFIKRPTIWLEKASQYKVTVTSSTTMGNKHYLSFLRRKREPAPLDLSRIRLIFNGAESISVSLCKEFTNELRQYGLAYNVIYPVYGMAEASLGVTFSIPGEGINSINISRKISEKDWRISIVQPGTGIEVVQVGFPVGGCNLRLVNEKNKVVKEDTIGRIQISGENVAKCIFYDELPTKTDTWVDTEDLGLLHNERLYIFGRIQDVLRVNSNVYIMSDLEKLGQNIGLELERTVFCSFLSRLVLFVLFKKDLAEFIPLQNKIRDYYQNQLGLQLEYVIPIRDIPKTTSGKVQKYKLIQSLINGQFDGVIEGLRGDESLLV